jgi:hypothetical protein
MRGRSDAKTLMNKLVDEALARTAVANPDAARLARAIHRGEEIPEICKPGAIINNLPQEDKDILKDLKAEDLLKLRPDSIVINDEYLRYLERRGGLP